MIADPFRILHAATLEQDYHTRSNLSSKKTEEIVAFMYYKAW